MSNKAKASKGRLQDTPPAATKAREGKVSRNQRRIEGWEVACNRRSHARDHDTKRIHMRRIHIHRPTRKNITNLRERPMGSQELVGMQGDQSVQLVDTIQSRFGTREPDGRMLRVGVAVEVAVAENVAEQLALVVTVLDTVAEVVTLEVVLPLALLDEDSVEVAVVVAVLVLLAVVDEVMVAVAVKVAVSVTVAVPDSEPVTVAEVVGEEVALLVEETV